MDENKLEESKSENNTETIFTEADFDMSGYDKHIRHARNACFISASLLFINALILFSKYPFDMTIFWLDYLLWIIYIRGFVFFGFFTKTKYTQLLLLHCVYLHYL
jgi:hypothetical protein